MDKARGCLTENFKNEAKKYLGREITQKELRLYPVPDTNVGEMLKGGGE